MLKLRTFGGLALFTQERPLTGAAAQRRPLALLSVLAVAGERGVSRERLQDLLWPESDEARARRVLAQTLYALRRDLGDASVIIGSPDLSLNRKLIEPDVCEFEHSISTGELERAVTLYKGPFLDGIHLPDAPEFEQWSSVERERLGNIAQQTLERLAREAVRRGDAEVAAGWWRRLAVLDPLNGRVAVGLMEALVASGDKAGALRHARVHDALLREQLGAPPDAAVRALASRLCSPDLVVRPATPPPSTRSSELPGAVVNTAPPGALEAPQEIASPSLPHPVSPIRPRIGWRRLAIASLGIGLTIAVAGVLVQVLTARQRDTRVPTEKRVLVVIPFDVADTDLRLWREGMVDVLSRNLDDTGPLRMMSPTVVIRDWKGRADHDAVEEFARGRTADAALYGQLLSAGQDSVRVSATLLDVRRGEPIAEFRRQDLRNRMDRLTDSLTVDVLRAIARTLPGSAARTVPATSRTSFEALRAFLHGEQFFRRGEWDLATNYYQRAVATDSTFALAWRRLGLVASWQRLQQDSLTAALLLRAGAANYGLSLRDSLLVAADSLAAAATVATNVVSAFAFTRRLFATLDSATARYPDDPEVWFALGEARYHLGVGPVVGVAERAALEAFDRAIALDSAFAPAYIHAVELGFNIGGAPLGLRYARTYLSRNPTEAAHRGVRLVEPLIADAHSQSLDTQRLLDTARTSAVVSARTILRRWPDSAETAVRLGRILAEGRPSEYPLFSNVRFMRRRLAEQLAFRGHLSESYRTLTDRNVALFAELAYLGAVPPSEAQATFERWMSAGSELAPLALAWWSAHGDTTSLTNYARRARTRGALAIKDSTLRARVAYDTASAHAHLALARRDTATALQWFLALPDTLCPACYLDRLTRARLLSATGRKAEAGHILDEPLISFLTPIEVLFALERGRVAMALGDSATARRGYAFVRAAWAQGDSAVSPAVTEAANALRRLSSARIR